MAVALLSGRFALLVPIALVTAFWLPALWQGKVLLHGDSQYVGFPLFSLLSRALHGNDEILWTSRITGGHPIFAEGQGGFASPLTILCAYLFAPAYGIGVLQWLNMLIGAAGVFCLCRVLEIGRWPAAFASIAVVFSGFSMLVQATFPMSATLAWVPWFIAGVEYWLKRPSNCRAAWMALPPTLMLFSGYPQIAHGAVLYVAASLLAQPFGRNGRRFVVEHGRKLLLSGLLAVALCVALSAIQLLPLLELVGLSQRSQGIALTFGGMTPATWIGKGALYFYHGGEQLGANRPTVGSSAVVLLAGLMVFLHAPVRILGQVFGAFLLFNLGAGTVSPVFRTLYDGHLLPGLDNYRITHPLFAPAVVGACVIAAYVLDCLSRDGGPRLWRVFQDSRGFAAACLAAYGVGAVLLCRAYYVPAYSPMAFLVPVVIALCYPLFGALHHRKWLPLVAVTVLCVDVTALRMDVFHFYEPKFLRIPKSVIGVLNDPALQDYRVIDSVTSPMAFRPPNDPDVGRLYRRVVKSLTAFPALRWKVPSINGPLALPTSRWRLLFPVIQTELAGVSGNVPGLRVMDIFGIRYVVRNAPLWPRPISTPRLSVFSKDSAANLVIYRNETARPRFQVYWNAQVVESPQQALDGLQSAHRETLFLENSLEGELPVAGPETSCSSRGGAFRIEVLEATSMRYAVDVGTSCEGWLFLADANYPGWKASVNGVPQPVYSAQVLGKAVHLKAGSNRVLIWYVPRAFYWGAGLSGLALLALLCIMGRYSFQVLGVWQPLSRQGSSK